MTELESPSRRVLLRDRLLGYLIVAYLVSVLLFDFVTRELGGFIFNNIGVNDFILCILIPFSIATVLRGHGRSTGAATLIGLFAVGYFMTQAVVSLGYGPDAFIREAQFAFRFLPMIILPVILTARPALFEWFLGRWAVLLWAVCGLATLQVLVAAGLGIEIIPWARGRTGLGLRQATSVLYEPAVFAQFLITSLFILFIAETGVRSRRKLFYVTLLTIVLTQSLSGLIAILVWLVVRTSRAGTLIRIGQASAIIGVLIAVLLMFFAVAPTNRYSIFLNSGNMELEGSAGRRVLVELVAFGEFLKTATWSEIAVGLPSIEAKYFRNMSNIVVQADGVAGNGMLEIVLRYGAFGLVLVALCAVIWFVSFPRKMFRILVFFSLLSQMDGAISKPWTFFYTAIYITLEYTLNAAEMRRKRTTVSVNILRR